MTARRASRDGHARLSRCALAGLALTLLVSLVSGCRTQQTTDFSRTRIAGAVYDEVGQPVAEPSFVSTDARR